MNKVPNFNYPPAKVVNGKLGNNESVLFVAIRKSSFRKVPAKRSKYLKQNTYCDGNAYLFLSSHECGTNNRRSGSNNIVNVTQFAQKFAN